MKQLNDNTSRTELLRYIASSTSYGNLGLFIGAGFSKAILNDKGPEIALSWGQLLERSAKQLGVEYSDIVKEGASYPEIASRICQATSKSGSGSV